MKLKYFWLIIISLIMVMQGSIPNDWYYGRKVNYTDGQSVALSGNDLFKPSVYLSNPLAKSLGKMQLAISYNLGFLLERRTKLVFDNFDNTIGEVAIAENLLTKGNLGKVSFLYPLEFMNVSISLQPQYDFEYYFYREFRDDFYAKIGEEELKVTGAVYKASVMVGKEFVKKFGIGAGFNYYTGSRNFSYHDSILGGNCVNAETTGSPSGIGFTVGISAMPIERLLMHFDFQSATNLKKWANNDAKKYPQSLNFAVSYLAAGEIPTKIGITAQYIDWKVFQNTYRPTIDIGLGIEHTMFNSVALRYGFKFEPSFIPPTVHQGTVSIGWGFMIGTMQIDIGADVKRRIITSENLMNPDDNTLKVYENTGAIIIGASIPIQ